MQFHFKKHFKINYMKKLVEQLYAEIKKAFENGDYDIAEIDSNGFIEIKFEGLPTTLSVLMSSSSCMLIIHLFNKNIEYIFTPFDIFLEKLAAFEAQNNAKQIADLEAKLQALKGGNNE
jgi:hypothetical protein